MKYLIITNRKWYKNLPTILKKHFKSDEFFLIDNKDDFTYEVVRRINPKYVFIPHWSHIVPENIFNNFECIIFHMTDLPFGRGGSPLQNLIVNKIYDTKISAIKCVSELDAGPIYLKESLQLYGTAEEIYIRASKVIEEMIIKIIDFQPIPKEQEGLVTYFKRRKPEEGNIKAVKDIQELYDFIRMLDAEDYPRAFLETNNFRFEFERASLKDECIISDVKITRKRDKNEK